MNGPFPQSQSGTAPALRAVGGVPPERSYGGFLDFVGVSPPIREVYRKIELAARSTASVFITGETGTGKDVCARTLHDCSHRAQKPFVAINCGAIPGELLESELFGHVRGAFTGAQESRVGLIASADGGTLFLDEICELDPRLQVKLLRFLQCGTIQRVGSVDPEHVDVRIICATNRDIDSELAAGGLRADLYYRLAVVPIELPPLRVRGNDCLLLANHYLQKFAAMEGKSFAKLGQDFVAAAAHYDWPGNVRELQNLMRRASVLCTGPVVPIQSLIDDMRPAAAVRTWFSGVSPGPAPAQTLAEIEHRAIEAAVAGSGGNLSRAAKALGISESTLYRRRNAPRGRFGNG